MDNSTHRAKITLAMRVAAGIWFATVFAVLSLLYFAYKLPHGWSFGTAIRSTEGLYWIVFPALVAGLCGCLLGANILRGTGPAPALLASLRGMLVGLVCMMSFVGFLALRGTVEGARHGFMQFVWLLIYVGLFWGSIATIPVVAFGGMAGFVLYCARQRLKKIM